MFHFLLIIYIGIASAVPPSGPRIHFDKGPQYEEIKSIKYSMKILAGELEKWNNIFITALEPQISNFGLSLVGIDSKVNNLQERAHVWDTFQLHLLAWNDQLASLDRKLDIMNKGQEELKALDKKFNVLFDLDYKLDKVIGKIEKLEEKINNQQNIAIDYHHGGLFNEFAARGILSTVKMVEKKIDRLLLTQQNVIIKTGKNSNDDKKINIKCNIPGRFEDLFNDMSSKIDLIFDKISIKEEQEYDQDYIEGSGIEPPIPFRNGGKSPGTNLVKRNQPCPNIDLTDLSDKLTRVENSSNHLQISETESFEKLFSKLDSQQDVLVNLDGKIEKMNSNFDAVLESHFSEQRAHFESLLNNHLIKISLTNPLTTEKPISFSTEAIINETTTTDIIEMSTLTYEQNTPFGVVEPITPSVVITNKSSCEDLSNDDRSGIYIFNKNFYYGRRYCEVREDGFWTVVQKRDNYRVIENFDKNWLDYKYGFGDLSRDFWMGNDFLVELSKNNLILRIELEDFDGNQAWAEYSNFKVFPESDYYQLVVEGYTGNASDSFSSHNGSYFSTIDRKNDQAPACCPCAQSYGGGWWFTSCFEANLNGEYFRSPNQNNYFRGIIWEHWLGNYSLKKTIMMVKTKGTAVVNKPDFQDYYEEP